VIDTHCHLTFPDFAGRVPQVLASAREAGVTGCVSISTTTRDCLDALAIARAHANVWCTSGIHPLHSHEGPHEWANLKRVAEDPRCVAWGELGLDNHYKEPARDVQDRVLAEHLSFIEGVHREWKDSGAPRIALPVVIHCREAFADLIPVLRRSSLDPARFVFHCFTGNADEARAILDLGSWISFTGVATYRNAREVQEAARIVPADRIMIETDAPFLSPEPKRGVRPCEPWMASLTARFIAQLRGTRWPDFERTIDDNTQRFFRITPPAAL
jgi:TatD DNase family protein